MRGLSTAGLEAVCHFCHPSFGKAKVVQTTAGHLLLFTEVQTVVEVFSPWGGLVIKQEGRSYFDKAQHQCGQTLIIPELEAGQGRRLHMFGSSRGTRVNPAEKINSAYWSICSSWWKD